MVNRIREAMNISDPAPMGSVLTAVEADETDQGHNKSKPARRAWGHLVNTASMVERRSEVRSFNVGRVTRKDPPAITSIFPYKING
jgi:hypothetical protein